MVSISEVTATVGDLTIARTTCADLEALARFHYRAGAAARPVLVLAARDGDELAGVLAVSMPVLNGPWRRPLWPGLLGVGGDKQAAACAVNGHVRTISRVIVDPRWRGMGVGTSLVRAYLSSPLTRFTESLSAAGVWSPIFARCGMRAVQVPPARRDVRLARELRRLRIPAWTLLEVSCAARQMRSRAVREAVERWARDGRGTRGLIGVGAPWELAVKGAASVLARPTAYGFERGVDEVVGEEEEKRKR